MNVHKPWRNYCSQWEVYSLFIAALQIALKLSDLIAINIYYSHSFCMSGIQEPLG